MTSDINSNPRYADVPLGLKLQQTLTSSGSVTLPPGVKRVYAVCIGGGGGGSATILPNIRKVTAISGDGTTVTYTVDNNFLAGMAVTTAGSSIAGYNVTNATIATASSTNFTITNATTGTPTLTNATATAQTITTGAAAGGTITAVTPSSPATNQVTYSTTTPVPVGVPVTISGASPAGYNGTFVVSASNPGTSFTVTNATTGTATGTITFTGVVRYTAANNYKVGHLVTMTGHSPTGFNLTSQLVVAASATEYTVANTLAQSTVWTSGGNSAFNVTDRSGGGGGGAGGYSAGWTYAAPTCIVGTGGAGGQFDQALTPDQTTLAYNNPNGNGKPGGNSIYGAVIAGGGSGGGGTSNFGLIAVNMGAGGGGNSPWITSNPSAVSYTGAASASSGNIGYGGGGGQNNAGGAGVSGGGGGRVDSAVTTASITANGGGRGLIGGGAGSVSGLNTITGASGGAGDLFAAGTGTSGTGVLVGAGGGGGGYRGAGGNASGNNGGNGGDGGGGGGAGNNNGTGGNGGNGVIYLYY